MSTTSSKTATELNRERAKAWDRDTLVQIWNKISSGESIADWSPGTAFEYLVIRAFQLEELEVDWPYTVTYHQKIGIAEQIDGLVRIDGLTFLIESKDHNLSASIHALAKLRFRLEGRPTQTMGLMFSRKDFSLPTEVFAQFMSPLNVILWSADDLEFALSHSRMKEGLRAKYAYATKMGLPLYSIRDIK